MKLNIIIAASLLVFVASCSSKKESTDNIEKTVVADNTVVLHEAQLKNINLELGQITNQNLSTTLKVNGKIDVPPQNLVSVSMPLGGYLKSTNLLPGVHVKKGEVIAVMEDQQFIQLQQDYLQVKSKLEFAFREYERQRDLNESQASSDKVFQLAASEYKSLRISLSALGEKLKLINVNPTTLNEYSISKSVNIYSPIDGYVSKVLVNIGKYVNPSDILFELINPADIHLNLNIFEKDINQIFIGQKLMAYTNSQPNKEFPCKIIQVSRDLSQEHTAEVHCHFDRYDKSLLPGMYMNAEIKLNTNLCATLPHDAVVNYEGKDFVFVETGKNIFKLVEVKVGNQDKNALEILNAQDLSQQKVVTKGAYTLLMKLKNTAEE